MKTFAPELSALIIILRSARPGDLDPAVTQIGRRGRNAPVGAVRRRSRDETGAPARIRLALPLVTASRPRRAGSSSSCRRSTNASALRREDLAVAGRQYLEAGELTARVMLRPLRTANCASSVEPRSASVEDSPPLTIVGDAVEVAGADFALVLRRRVSVRLERELALLQLDVGASSRRVA